MNDQRYRYIYFMPLKEAEPALGAGGQFSVESGKVTIEVLKGLRPFIEFADWEVLVPTTYESIPYAVLGRDSIFAAFNIEFRESEQKMIMKSH